MCRILTRNVSAAAVRTTRSALALRMSSAPNSRVATRRLHATAQHLKPAASLAFSANNYPTTHEKIQNVEDTPYFIDNQFVKSETTQYIELLDPATNNLVTRVPQSTDAGMSIPSISRAKLLQNVSRTLPDIFKTKLLLTKVDNRAQSGGRER
jgi:malonate-semialdehyde dehydrogenase (acetylating)/methylmalonate-semialdehyde dehydrogenase